VLPKASHATDSGYDLSAIENVCIPAKGSGIVETGLQVASIESGYWFHIMPRSGLGFKYGIQPHLGVIDSGYTGPLGVKLYNFSDTDYKISAGDRIAQIVIYPLICADIEWTDNIKETDRGCGGLGHTGS
jgi:dUTP pyrophosphatase